MAWRLTKIQSQRQKLKRLNKEKEIAYALGDFLLT